MPTHGGNGQAGSGAVNGEELAVAAERAPEASERATSSVLALDGWGRLDPEPHVNGAAAAVAEPEPEEAEPLPTPPTERDFERHLEPLPSDPPWQEQSAEASGQQVGVPVLRLGRLELEAGPGMRLFASALVFGLAAGAVVGAALRWLELRNAPPPLPPPPDDLISRLRRAWDAFSMPDAAPRRRQSR